MEAMAMAMPCSLFFFLAKKVQYVSQKKKGKL